MNRPFPKLSKIWILVFVTCLKIRFNRWYSHITKRKSWKFRVVTTSRSKVIALSFSVKLLLYITLQHPASFLCKHVFSLFICEWTRNSFYLKIWHITHFSIGYFLKKEWYSNSNFNFWNDVIIWLRNKFRERSIIASTINKKRLSKEITYVWCN